MSLQVEPHQDLMQQRKRKTAKNVLYNGKDEDRKMVVEISEEGDQKLEISVCFYKKGKLPIYI